MKQYSEDRTTDVTIERRMYQRNHVQSDWITTARGCSF